MTSVTLYTSKEGLPDGYLLEGHAGFDDAGRDIVCAAVSALAINCANALDELTEDEVHAEADKSAGRMLVRIRGTVSHDAALLLQAFALGVQGIEAQYGQEWIKVIHRTP